MTNELKDRISRIRNGEVPEGYKRTVCGIVPKEWNEIKFGSLIQEFKNKTKIENEDVLLSSSINGVFLNSELFDHQRGTSNIGYLKINYGTLILSAQNLHLGNANVNLRFEHGIISPAYKTYRFINCNTMFMSFWIKREETKRFFYSATTAGASQCRRNVEWDALYEQTLLLPSLEEQQKIVEILSTQDKVIALEERCIEELKKLKKAYLQKIFPKNGEVYPEIRFKGFTDAWEQRKFGNIAQRLSETAVSCDELPYIEYEDVISNQGILNKDVSSKEGEKTGIVFSEENVLYGKLRPYLHNWLNPDFKGVAVGDWWVLKPINADKNFLYRLIQSDNFDSVTNQSTGTKMPRADWKLVSATEFCLPKSLEEQAKIGQFFTDLDHLITLHQRKLEQEKQKKKALMQLLLTGIVRVRI